MLLVVLTGLSLLAATGIHLVSIPIAGADSIRTLPIGYAGVDYYDPSEYFTHCPDYTWLQNSCYDNPANPDPPRKQLVSDLSFVTSQHVGSVQRVWISLDQLMRWSPAWGFSGFRPGALHNVDDMLSLYHLYGIKVILVVYVYDRAGRLNEFRAQALDGNHEAMRSDYLRAERIFLRHLARNSIDVAAAPIIELANEPYFQLEEYFNDPAHLGRFKSCASEGRTDWGCVDQRIIHPWLVDLYQTARRASSKLLYTFSDTGRLLENYAHWSRMYPEDLIDEHLYAGDPWDHTALYARALRFTQPWIATEVGCATGNVGCTYSGVASSPVDSWWLKNLGRDGAQAVLVDSHVTVWDYPDGPNSQVPTRTGRLVQLATRAGRGPIPASPQPPRRPQRGPIPVAKTKPNRETPRPE